MAVDLEKANNMRRVAFLLVAVLGLSGSAARIASASGEAAGKPASISSASPIYGVTIPPGYRDWQLIAVNHLQIGKLDQLRAQLGNEKAYKAFKEGKASFPDGAIIAALHWTRVPSEENDKALAVEFPGAQSFVIGPGVNIQIMVKDSKKYAASGGWGFGDFRDGKPGDEALTKTCFPCHQSATHDFVFAHYAPAP
jgi:Cytochrome P460